MAQIAEMTTKTDLDIFICKASTDAHVLKLTHYCNHRFTETGSTDSKNAGGGVNENCLSNGLYLFYCNAV